MKKVYLFVSVLSIGFTVSNDWNLSIGKGYGFIRRDDGLEDVFCSNKSVLLEEPHLNPKVGTSLEFAFEDDHKRGHAVNVTAIGGGPVEGGRSIGTVKSWYPEYENGRITADDGSGDLAVGIHDLWEESQCLAVGDKCEYDPMQGAKEWFATYVTKVGGRILLCKICGGVGHQCGTNEVCYTCGKMGHLARVCPRRVGKGLGCNRCGQIGHFARDCPDFKCNQCGEQGHYGRNCPSSTCFQCGQTGHSKRDCPQAFGKRKQIWGAP